MSLKRLRSSRIPVAIRLQSGQAAELLAIALALQSGLRTTLEYIAVSHGCRDDCWLDELERTLINDASNVWAEGVPIDVELRALESGRKAITTLIRALREQLKGYEQQQ